MLQIIKTHSKLGMASCVIGITMFLIMFGLVIASFFVEDVTDNYKITRGVLDTTVGVAILLPVPTHLIGLIIGVVALFFPNRKKLFSIVGAILNFIFGLFGFVLWYAIAWLIAEGIGKGWK